MESFRGQWVKEREAWRLKQEEYRKTRRECRPLQELGSFTVSFPSARSRRTWDALPSTAETSGDMRRPQSAIVTSKGASRVKGMSEGQVEKVRRLAIRRKEKRLVDMNGKGMFESSINEVRARCMEQAEIKSWYIRMTVNTRKRRVQLGWARMCKRLFDKVRWSFLDDAHNMQGGDLLASIIVSSQSTASGKKKLNDLANAQSKLGMTDYERPDRLSELNAQLR